VTVSPPAGAAGSGWVRRRHRFARRCHRLPPTSTTFVSSITS